MSKWKVRGQKRTKGKFDDTKFINQEAENRYQDVIINKNIVPERGFFNPGGRVEGVINAREWEYFVASPADAVVPLVREFYANARDPRDSKVFVRGKWVPFTSESINQAYQTPNFDIDEYSLFINSEIDYDQILRCLGRHDSGVSWKRREGKIVNLPATALNAESKAWHYFISGKLMPTGNTSEVTKERAVLNFCIQNQMTIDVGKIIYQSLQHMIRGSSTSGLGHPSLITQICEMTNIQHFHDEEIQHPKAPLTKQKIYSYAAHSMNERGESSSRPPPPKARGATLTEQVASLGKEVKEMKETLSEHTQWHHQMQNEMRHYYDQQQQHYEYTANFNLAMETMFENCSLNIGPRKVDFPEPPAYHPYRQEEPEGEEEEEEEE